jgi:hypothetical protein
VEPLDEVEYVIVAGGPVELEGQPDLVAILIPRCSLADIANQ